QPTSAAGPAGLPPRRVQERGRRSDARRALPEQSRAKRRAVRRARDGAPERHGVDGSERRSARSPGGQREGEGRRQQDGEQPADLRDGRRPGAGETTALTSPTLRAGTRLDAHVGTDAEVGASQSGGGEAGRVRTLEWDSRGDLFAGGLGRDGAGLASAWLGDFSLTGRSRNGAE